MKLLEFGTGVRTNLSQGLCADKETESGVSWLVNSREKKECLHVLQVLSPHSAFTFLNLTLQPYKSYTHNVLCVTPKPEHSL